MKDHLVAVTGMSPAVVTETLYGIYRNGLPWPQSISILTTAKGEQRLSGSLPQAIESLCKRYGQTLPALEVHVIPGASGEAIEDARSLEDHEALGDFILRHVRDLTRDENVRVHASIAGGRKTMTFYLGYAMSLFGRLQDRLSHVLVSEPYETLPGFFYPTPEQEWIDGRNGERLDASQAEVVLADIPFLRLRDSLPGGILLENTDVRFRHLVWLINLGDAEGRELRIRLTLPADEPVLVLRDAGEQDLEHRIELKPADYAFYRALLRAQVSRGGLWQREELLDEKEKERIGSTDQAVELAMELAHLNGLAFDRESVLLTDLLDALEEEEIPMRPDIKLLRGLRTGLNKTDFSKYVNNIRTVLEAQLPTTLRRWLEPRVIANQNEEMLAFYGREFPYQRSAKNGYYGIALRNDAIQLLD